MKKHSLKDLLGAVRYWSFPVSVMPVIVTFAYLHSKGLVPSGFASVTNLLLCIAGVMVLHAAGNLITDYYDFKSYAEKEKDFAAPGLVTHKFEAKEYLLFSMMLLSTGCLPGLFLIMKSGYELLILGCLSIVLVILYPYLKHRAMGGLDIFLIIAIISLGTSCVFTGKVCYDSLLPALPVAFITISALHANNVFDMETDRNAGVSTFAMVIGAEASVYLYALYIVLPFLLVLFSVIFGYLTPFALLCFFAAIPAYNCIKAAQRFKELGIRSMKGLDKASAKLQIIFSALLSTGFFLSSTVILSSCEPWQI